MSTWFTELQDHRTDELADNIQYDIDLTIYSINELNDMLVSGYISPVEFDQVVAERAVTKYGTRRA
jgi:hypothetical protein